MKKKFSFIILVLLALPVLARNSAPNTSCKEHLKNISTSLEMFYSEQGAYPDNLDQLTEALSADEKMCPLTELPYRYEKVAVEGQSSFRVMCLGRAHFEEGQRRDYFITELQGPSAYEGPPLETELQRRLDEEFKVRHHNKFWGQYGDIAILLSVVVGIAVFLKLLGFIVGRMRESGKRSAVEQSIDE